MIDVILLSNESTTKTSFIVHEQQNANLVITTKIVISYLPPHILENVCCYNCKFIIIQ